MPLGYRSGDVDDVQRLSRFTERFITEYESWVYNYNIEIKVQLSTEYSSFDPFVRIVKYRRAHQNTINLSICQKQTDNKKWADIVNVHNRHVHQHNRKKRENLTYVTHEI